MKKYLITGLVVLLPLALTFWVTLFVIGLLTDPFIGVARNVLGWVGLGSSTILEAASTLLAIILFFGIVIGIGAVGRHFFFKYLMQFSDAILHRIPLINTVYKTSQEFIQTLMTSSSQSFKRVVLVPFPHKEAKALGFVTREDIGMEGKVSVLVPTSPLPTSGFLLMYKKEEIVETTMTVEEAMRYILSCGVLMTPAQKDVP
jgi:uncharacterized membrane protein